MDKFWFFVIFLILAPLAWIALYKFLYRRLIEVTLVEFLAKKGHPLSTKNYELLATWAPVAWLLMLFLFLGWLLFSWLSV